MALTVLNLKKSGVLASPYADRRATEAKVAYRAATIFSLMTSDAEFICRPTACLQLAGGEDSEPLGDDDDSPYEIDVSCEASLSTVLGGESSTSLGPSSSGTSEVAIL